MKPIVHGISKPMDLEIFEIKRTYTDGEVKFECPACGEVFLSVDLSSGDALEYGSFFSPEYCDNCDQEFEQVDYEITAEITIKIKGDK